MPFPNILNKTQIREFDKPPVFKSEDRKIFFDIPKSLEIDLSEMRNDTNKLVFILMFGYFKYSKKFFTPNVFNKKDVNYVVNRYHLEILNLNLKEFSRSNFLRYKNTILKHFNISYFESNKELLIKEAKNIVQKRFKMKAIFQGLLDFLYLKKIEIPSYNLLAEIITNTVNDYEKDLLSKLLKYLNSERKSLLDDLLEKIETERTQGKNYKLTKLKRFEYSTRPQKIKDNIDSLKVFKKIFESIDEIIKVMNLSQETIEYYAGYTISANSSQLKTKKDKKYIYLISFVIHQYYFLQDLLIDILLATTKTNSNTSNRENDQNYSKQKKDKEKKIVNIAESYEKNILTFFDEIEQILYSKSLDSEQKVKESMKLLESTKKNRNNIKNDFETIKKDSSNKIKNKDLFEIFNNKSKKLQRRASEIIKIINFDSKTSNKRIIEAIDHYKLKNGSIDSNAPYMFIDDSKKQDALHNDEGKFQVSLYKVFLFQEIADFIKSGRLNIKYSYRYKSINEYLIDKELWKNNKLDMINKSGLIDFQDFNKLISNLKSLLDKSYKTTNKNILNSKNNYISFKNSVSYVLTTPKTEDTDKPPVSDLFTGQENISLINILSDVSRVTSFLDSIDHYTIKYSKQKPKDNVFFAGLVGYGCNIGKNKISKISTGINEYELENVVKWYFDSERISSANNKILSFIDKLNLPNIYRKNKNINHTSSDGQKYALDVDSITGNYSYKYFGTAKGVSIYTFIDERHLLFYSTVISASEREAGYVIDGLMNNEVIQSDIHSTDTHGYTEMIFAITHFLGYSFAPRIKNFKDKSLYCFDSISKKEYIEKGFKILPNTKNYINTKVLEENWDDVLRFIATIKLRETTASQLLKRLSSYSRKNKLYQALNEFGKIISTIFALKYIDDVKLRQSIEKQLNKVESANRFAKAIFFGNNQEIHYAARAEQELAESCKRLIENSIICWNYIYLSQKLSDILDKKDRDKMIDIIKSGSVVFWKHINMFGEYNFSEEILNKKLEFDIPKILELKVA